MSTRIDIASDMGREPPWRLTYELFADHFAPGVIFLHLPGVSFVATETGVRVGIPVATWEEIRRFGAEKVPPPEPGGAESSQPGALLGDIVEYSQP